MATYSSAFSQQSIAASFFVPQQPFGVQQSRSGRRTIGSSSRFSLSPPQHHSHSNHHHSHQHHGHHTLNNHHQSAPTGSSSNSSSNSRFPAYPFHSGLKDGSSDDEAVYRGKFEAARSFELEDDEIYCPTLLTEDDLVSMYAGSETSSTASRSPNQSPLQMHAYSAMPGSLSSSRLRLSMSPSAPSFKPSPPSTPARPFQVPGPRKRNPIPIVNPNSSKSKSS